MSPPIVSGIPIVLWQGFHHRWQYNHRVKRLGSYVEHKSRTDGSCEAEVIHTAASGTGPDRADFTEVFTKIKARGVGFQPGVRVIRLVTVEDRLTDFSVRTKVTLDSELEDKENYTVVLNGFDLYADDDPDKLMTLALEVTDPESDDSQAALTFNIKGAFRVDCSSAECDRIIPGIREEYGHEWPKSIYMLDRELLAAPEVSNGQHAQAEDAPVVINRVVGPLTREVYYTLRVHYVIVGGNGESLHIAPSRLIEHPPYRWTTKEEIFSHAKGKRSLSEFDVIAGNATQEYAGSTLAFKQIIMSLNKNRRRRLWPWQHGSAMHLLELNTAISDIREIEPGSFTCTLDMFFKNWTGGMKIAHLWHSLFAYKDAGEAQFGARLLLLQFKDVDLCQQSYRRGHIFWPGGDKEATSDPAAQYTTHLYVG